MSEEPRPLRKLGSLTIGLFDGDDPGPGHRSTLSVIELGEQLGLDTRGFGTATCSTASPRRSPCWPLRRSAPAASSWAPP